jgi:dTDP-4-amino-4,6-dideoxygalactose transaminase
MDVSQVEARITPRTKAILPVHLYGQSADLGPILEIGQKYGIPVVEDAAQAHGATYCGKPAGTLGVAGCFSFYPGKNLGAYGEAGAVVTNDVKLADRMRSLRDHAQEKRYHHSELGFNYRMDAFQGAILRIKLKRLAEWTERRRELARHYEDLLGNDPLQLPTAVAGRGHVWHLFVVLHPQRDQLRAKLEAANVQTGLHYPIPLHLQKAYQYLGYGEGDFPVAERIGRECLTLPLFPEMTEEQQTAVVAAIKEALQ